jgi:hypothetical protein
MPNPLFSLNRFEPGIVSALKKQVRIVFFVACPH